MAQLRQLLSDNGFSNVQTWIQSGNVILDSMLSHKEVGEKVNRIIKEGIGADLKIIVKTPAHDISRVFFALSNDLPEQSLLAAFQALDFGEDKFAISPHAIYLFVPESFAKTRLNNNFLERKLKIDVTIPLLSKEIFPDMI